MKRKTVPKKIRNSIYNDLYIETNKLLRETEKRLRRLERGVDINKAVYNPKTKRYERKNTFTIISDTGKRITIKPSKIVKYNVDSWAAKKLNEKLSMIKGVDIKLMKAAKLPKQMNIGDLKAANKAFKNFIKSKTSTIKGIKETENRIKKSISDIFDTEEEKVNAEDVETFYSFFEDPDFRYVSQFIDPSELMVILEKVASSGGTADDFLREIENYIYSDSLYQDDDLVDALTRLYNKFAGK